MRKLTKKLLFIALLLPVALQAQHVRVTIGDGTVQDIQMPFNCYYNNGTTQQLYYATEIIQTGHIDTIWFYSATTNTLQANSLKIYLGTYSGSVLTYMIPAGIFTEVYSATAVTLGGTVGWQPFALDVPYQYDGTSNLVVAVCRQDDSYNNQVRYMCTSSSTSKAMYRRSDTDPTYGDINCTSPAHTYTCRANLRLSIDQNYTPPACAKPTGLAITDMYGPNATLSWHEAGTATAWMVEYGPAPFTPGSSANTTLFVSDTTAILSSLSPLTQYTAAVYALCGNGDTSQYSSTTFTSGCAVIDSLPFVQDFESAPTGSSGNDNFMPCWSHLNDAFSYSGNPYVISYAGYNHTPGGGKALIWNNSSFGTHQCIALPGVDNSIDVNNLQLRFWAYANQPTMPIHLQVGVMSDPDDFSTFTPTNTLTISSTSWAEYICPLTTYTGTGKYVAISAQSGNIWSGPLDDFTLEWIDQCPQTSELHMRDSSATSITLSWTEYGQAAEWVIEYDTADFVPGNNLGTTVLSNDTLFTITGLDSACTYYIYLHAYCGDDTSLNRFLLAHTMGGNPAPLPYQCNFEAPGANGWTFVNGNQPNGWYVGSAAHNGTGSRGLYISNDGGITNAYDTNYMAASRQVSYAYRTLIFPDSAEYMFSFDWRANGENNFDYLRAFLAPDTVHFVPGQMPAGSQISFNVATVPAGWIEVDGHTQLSLSPNWQNYAGTATVPAGNYHLVFMWVNEFTDGAQPPAAVDNIYVDLNYCPMVRNLHATNISATSATIEWQLGGTEWQWVVSDGVNTYLANDTAYTFNNLYANSTYHYTVSPLCDGTDTGFAQSITLRTGCGPIEHLPFTEDFEFCTPGNDTSTAFLPCWNRLNNSLNRPGYPYIEDFSSYNHTPDGNQGLYWFYASSTSFNASDFGDYYTLSLPPVSSLFPIGSLQLNFWAKVPTAYTPTLQVGVMSDPDSIGTFSAIDSVTILGNSSYTWQYVQIPLEAYAGQPGSYITLKAERPANAFSMVIDDITLDLIPSCAHIGAISTQAIAPYSATISWDGDNTLDYQVEYGPAGFAAGSGTMATVSADTSIALSGLSANTLYTIRVRAICGAGDTSVWRAYQFQTTCDYITLPYFEDFESAGTSSTATGSDFIGCWTRLNNGTTYGGYPYVPAYGSISHNGGSKSLTWYNSTITGIYGDYQCAVLPPLSPMTPANNQQLSFWLKSSSATYYPVFQIGVMTDPNDISTFVCVDNITPVGGYDWNYYEVPLNAYTGTGQYVAIRADRHTANGTIYMDDLTLEAIPSCPTVTNLEAIARTTTLMDLVWFDPMPGTGWQYEYGPAGFGHGDSTATLGFTTVRSLTLTGLQPNTAYDIYVRHICSATDTSDWKMLRERTAFCDSTVTAITYGYGTATTVNDFPGPSFYKYSYCETIIDSAELVGVDQISAFAFHPVSANGGGGFGQCQVYLGHTDSTTFNHHCLYDSTFTLVYSGSLNYNDNGWQTFAFDTVFAYDGHSNLVLVINRQDSLQLTGSSFWGHDNGVGKTYSNFRSNVPFVPGQMTNGYTSNSRSDIQLLSCVPVCPRPYILSETHDCCRISLTWDGSGDTYEVAAKPNTSNDWPASTMVNSHSVTLSGLSAATNYEVRLRQVCGEGEYSDWRMLYLTTDSLPCFAPEGLGVIESGFDYVKLNWTPTDEETEWVVRVYRSDTAFMDTVGSHPVTISGLYSGHTYSATVQSKCGGGASYSDWCTPIQFTTDLCPSVSNVQVSQVGATHATVNWTPADAQFSNWQVNYGDYDFQAGTGIYADASNTPEITLDSLTPNSEYNVYVRTACTATAFSDWSQKVDFYTLDPSGIAETEGMAVRIYPNPASGATTISLSGVEGTATIEVVDMNGRSVATETLNCAANCMKRMDVSALPKGAYFVRICSAGYSSVKKLIVK